MEVELFSSSRLPHRDRMRQKSMFGWGRRRVVNTLRGISLIMAAVLKQGQKDKNRTTWSIIIRGQCVCRLSPPALIISGQVKFRWQLDVRSVATFTKLYIKRFLDNLIPLGDVVKPFLCQFPPSLWFNPPPAPPALLAFISGLPQTACSLC